jgi:hypothetical protein
MHAATKQQRHITGEKRPRPTFCFAVQSLGMKVRERLHLVFLEIRVHRYCSYLVAMSLPCFLFCCSISWGMNFRERLPFGVPRNPHAPVYLFKELLLISRCHAISLRSDPCPVAEDLPESHSSLFLFGFSEILLFLEFGSAYRMCEEQVL